jgi:5-(carboxyamino)imidazole ribonucleotide mutase
MGSRSDEEALKPCLDMLTQLGVSHEAHVMSAHRNPQRVRDFVTSAPADGVEVFIAAAGLAAHLPGVVAAWTTLPVIGLPLAAGELRGLDSLYAIVQMPPGIPVATVGIGNARNAALLATAILALKYDDIRQAYEAYRKSLSEG